MQRTGLLLLRGGDSEDFLMIKRESPLSHNQQQKVSYAINGFPRTSKWLLLCHLSIQINQEMIYYRDSEERCREYVSFVFPQAYCKNFNFFMFLYCFDILVCV